jgi:hypothetical protein
VRIEIPGGREVLWLKRSIAIAMNPPARLRLSFFAPLAALLLAASCGASGLQPVNSPVELMGKPVRAGVRIPPALQPRVAAVLSGTAPGRRLVLNVEDISAARNPGIVYEVYLNLPRKTEPGGEGSLHYVGLLPFYGIDTGGKHSFNVTNTARALNERGLWQPGSATVTFVPLGLIQSGGGEEERQPVPAVTIGRVRFAVE